MNIVIPMAGDGIRFANAGFAFPKPLVDVGGKPMIQRVVENLNITGNYIFIVREEHEQSFGISKVIASFCKHPYKVIQLKEKTNGQAVTVASAASLIDNNEPLLIVNSDNYFIWDVNNFLLDIDNHLTTTSGFILTFKDYTKNKNWSYAKVTDDGYVEYIQEKAPISTNALAGAFYWSEGRDYIEYYNKMITERNTVNGEYYVSLVYNYAIDSGRRVRHHEIDSMKSMGTPSELQSFISWIEQKKVQYRLDDLILNYNSYRKIIPMNRKIKNVLQEIRQGKPIILVDEYDRENEGDIVIAAEKATAENLVFTMNQARGLMCIPASDEILKRLDIPPMVVNNTDKNQTPFTVSVDAKEGTTTGMSVQDRLKTISILLSETSQPGDLARPGHLFPLRARAGLLKDRRGHTEGSLELLKLAGLKPMAIICEIMNSDGTMAKGGSLEKFAVDHGLSIISMEEVYEAAYNESLQ